MTGWWSTSEVGTLAKCGYSKKQKPGISPGFCQSTESSSLLRSEERSLNMIRYTRRNTVPTS